MKKIAYFDVLNGCAGDMIVGSLIDAGLDIKVLEEELKKLNLENFKLEVKKVKRKNNWGHIIEGTQFLVIPTGKWDDETPYFKIVKIIEESTFRVNIKEKILKIFDILADSESKVHKTKKEELHFHQVGQIDAIVEIASVIIGLDILGIEEIFSSPVGIANLAPATIEILKEIPTIPKNTPFEITTPTGASIIKGISNFSPLSSEFFIENVGYGAGIREFPPPNILKFFIGKLKEEKTDIVIIETNIDDTNSLLIGNLIEKIIKNGALDISVFCGIGKKNRPIFKVEILVPESKFNEISNILFQETTTIGFRYRRENRVVLDRTIKEVNTELGKVRVKIAYREGKIVNLSPEYEDCKKISEEKNIPLKEVYQRIYKNLENRLK